MQPKNCTPVFELTDRSNQELVEGAKHLVVRHRTVTAHLIAHLAEIYARKLHLAEGFSYLGDYRVVALGMSEDEAHRRAHAAVLAQRYPVILDLLLEGSIHLTTLRILGKCLTPKNHRQVLEGARGKTKTELEHLAAQLCPKADVATVLRKLPEPRAEVEEAAALFARGGAEAAAEGPATRGAEVMGTPLLAPGIPAPSWTPPALSTPGKSCLAPLSPQRYNLQVTVDEETYKALKQLQDLLRHQIRNGDLSRIIKDAVVERLEHVKREKFGHTKRPRKAREQANWIESERTAAEVRIAAQERPIAGPEGVEEGKTAQTGTQEPVQVLRAESGE